MYSIARFFTSQNDLTYLIDRQHMLFDHFLHTVQSLLDLRHLVSILEVHTYSQLTFMVHQNIWGCIALIQRIINVAPRLRR